MQVAWLESTLIILGVQKGGRGGGRESESGEREESERERVSYFSVGVDGLVVVDVD